jgi:hypothetical protein
MLKKSKRARNKGNFAEIQHTDPMERLAHSANKLAIQRVYAHMQAVMAPQPFR